LLPETCRAKLDLSIKKVIVASSWISSLPSLLMMHGQTYIKFLKLTNLVRLLHTNKAHLPFLHPPQFPLLYLERKLLLPEGRADIAWEAEVLHNFLFACCKFSLLVTWSSHNWPTSYSQANPQPHSTSLCLNFIHRTAAIWLRNAVLYVNAHLVLQPQLVSH